MPVPKFNIILSEKDLIPEHRKIVDGVRSVYHNYTTKLVILSEEDTLYEVFLDLQKMIIQNI